MDKYQRALLELYRAKKAVMKINQEIGYSLDLSRQAAEVSWEKDQFGLPEPPKEWRDIGGKNLWLHLAYQKEYSVYEGMYYVNHDDDVRGYLAEHCGHALHAHDLIQARKELRKELGIAKRRVTFLGNKLLRSMEVSNG